MICRGCFFNSDKHLYAFCSSAVLILAALLTGCAPARPVAPDPAMGPATLEIYAEWRHIEPSMQIAVRRAEMAITDRQTAPATKRFELQSVRDESGWLVVTPLVDEPFPHDEPIPMRVETSIGLFGNPSAERRLLRALTDRLDQLRGREWAPVR